MQSPFEEIEMGKFGRPIAFPLKYRLMPNGKKPNPLDFKTNDGTLCDEDKWCQNICIESSIHKLSINLTETTEFH